MVKNSITKNNQNNSALVTIEANGASFQLSPQDVKNYLISGDKDRVTMQEVVTFLNLCRFAHLNPWMKEAYCIKYGNEPATMVVGKEAFQKRAEANPAYDGMDSGIVVMCETGDIEYRRGTITIEGDQIIGGWAEVWRKDRAHSTRVEVAFNEYAGRKKDGSLNGQWSKRPATMIRKVALVQALRDAFPSSFGGMYTAEEQGYEEEITMPEVPTEVEEPTQEQEPQGDVAAALFGGEA